MKEPSEGVWRLLGAPYWPLDGADVFASLGQKARALLALAIVSQSAPTREDTASVLWPQADHSRGRHNLRQTLVNIRKTLGERNAEMLATEGERIDFNPSGIRVDLHRFAEIEGGAATTPEELLDLCRGPLLEGFESGSDAFDELIAQWRSRLSDRIVAVLDRGIEKARRRGDAKLVAALGQRRAQFAPPGEAVERAQPTAPEALARRGLFWRFRWIWATLAGFALGAAIFIGAFAISSDFRSFLRQNFVGEAQNIPRIAVRPFTSTNSTEAEQRLAGGVTIGVTYALYAITARELFVVTVPPDSEEKSDVDAQAYAQELGVRYLITGTLEWDNDLVRVFVRCIDGETGIDVWQDRFDSDVTEAFSLQDEITLRILRGLEIDLSSAERNRIQYLDDTDDLNAWLYAANGVRHLIKLDPSSLGDALVSYRKALEIDPDYTSARRGLAWHALLKVRFGISTDPAADLLEARNQLNVILRRKPDDGMSRGLEGLMLLLENNWDESVNSGLEATRLLPGSADVWAVLAHSYTFSGEPEKAIEAIDRAMSLSPGHPPFYNWIKGRALRLTGQYEAAIEQLSRGREGEDRTMVQLVELAIAYSAARRLDDAHIVAEQIRRVSPDFSASTWVLHPSSRDAEQQSVEFELLTRAGL